MMMLRYKRVCTGDMLQRHGVVCACMLAWACTSTLVLCMACRQITTACLKLPHAVLVGMLHADKKQHTNSSILQLLHLADAA